MNRLAKILGLAFAVLVLVLVAGITFTIGWRPFIGPKARVLTSRRFQSTPERIARGEYGRILTRHEQVLGRPGSLVTMRRDCAFVAGQFKFVYRR